MDTIRICQQCRKPLPQNAPEGLYPECLARAALGTEPAAPGGTINVNPAAEAAAGARVPPKPADLAAQFPQLEILELLGMGGMGMVYKARQPQLDRLVALKILPMESAPHPSFAERFTREAKALAKLNHPGIVAVYDFGQTEQYYFFVMEYVDGMNLRQLLRTQPLEPKQALELVSQICTALQFAHDEGVVHRDIKPENILLNKKGQLKIADFGLAKLLGEQKDTALTMSQAMMGTMNYMAPEQRQNAQGVDHRADIYSLGVVFYEMLTGEVPMGRFEAPSKRVQVDVRLDEVVLKALEREPEQRYQKASEVKTDLESVARSTPAPSPAGAPLGASFEFATPGTETAAELEGRKIRRFWMKAIGWWLLAWLFAAIVWTMRPAGVVSGIAIHLIPAVAIYCLIWWTLTKRLSFIRQLSSEAGQLFKGEYGFWRKLLAGYVLTGIIHLIMLLPIMALGAAALGSWEMLHWNPAARTASSFLAEYGGKEHRLLRILTGYGEAVPVSEIRLVGENGSPWPGVSVAGELLFAFLYLQFPPLMVFGWVRARFSWANYWRPWLAYFATVTGTGLVVFFGIFGYSHFFSVVGRGHAQPVASWEIRTRLPADAVRDALLSCMIERGYQPCGTLDFSFDSIPKGEPIGLLRVFQYWKPANFDRWAWDRWGFQRISPHFVVQMLSSEKPVETVLTVNSSSGDLFGREAAAEWQTVCDALAAALRSKEAQH